MPIVDYWDIYNNSKCIEFKSHVAVKMLKRQSTMKSLINKCLHMSNKEVQDFSEKLRRGLLLAEKKMLQEKALHGESIVVCDNDNNSVRIPASEVIAQHKAFR
jgi:hypothetical protein